MNKIKVRRDWIDALRAIAMLNVMIWHMSNGLQSQWIYSVGTASLMIPLFFSITGYVFNDCNGDVWNFSKKIFKYLVIPWIILSLAKGFIIAVLKGGGVGYYFEFILNLFNGKNLWYFPCCIIAQILHFYVIKISNNSIFRVIIYSCILSLGGLILSRFSLFDYLNISTAFICQFFLLLGYIMRYNLYLINGFNQIVGLSKSKNRFKFCFLCIMCMFYLLLICMQCKLFPNNIPFDVHHNYYISWFVVILIIIGVFTIFILFNSIKSYPKLLLFIGKNTIVFYVFHYDSIIILSLLFSLLGITIENSWMFVFVKVIWSIFICSIISIILNKYIPFVVGRRLYHINTKEKVPS